jgi:hypothetical protein
MIGYLRPPGFEVNALSGDTEEKAAALVLLGRSKYPGSLACDGQLPDVVTHQKLLLKP